MSKVKTKSFTDSDIVVVAQPAPDVPEEGESAPVEAVETAEPKPTTNIITFAAVLQRWQS